MEKILFIKPANYSFTVNDQKILEKHFRVKSFLIARKNAGFHFIWRIINLKLFIIFNSIGTSVMITWFADYHAAVMVILGKILNIKVVIIAGGQEVGSTVFRISPGMDDGDVLMQVRIALGPTVPELSGKTILLSPSRGADDHVQWLCVPVDIPARYLPKECRG